MSKIVLTFQPKSLYQLAEEKTCQSLWNRTEVRKILQGKLEELSLEPVDPDEISNLLEYRDKNNKILNQVYNNIQKLVLPIKFKNNLKVLARAMGIIIWNWLERMNDDLLGTLTSYVDHIKWTSDCTIDTAETFRSMYYAKIFPDCEDTWMKLSSYCLEDCLEDFFNRVKIVNYVTPKIGQSNARQLSQIVSPQAFGEILSFYWSKLLQNRLDESNADSDSSVAENCYNNSEISNVSMFILALEHLNVAAVKYFWKLMTEKEKIKISEVIFERFNFSELLDIKSYTIDSWLCIQKHISPYGDHRFVIIRLDIPAVTRKIFTWPWEDLFMSALEDSWLHISDYDLHFMFGNICIFMGVHLDEGEDDISKYRYVFRKIWSKINTEYKKSMSLLPCIYYLGQDHESLEVIINDPILMERRWTLIELTAELWASHSVKVEPKMIEEFCTIVLKNDAERTFFRKHAVAATN